MNNLCKRTITGIVFVAVMVFGIIWDRLIFSGLFLLILWVSMKEFYNMSMGTQYLLQQKMALVCGALAFLTVAALEFVPSASSYTIKAGFLAALALLVLIPLSCIFKSDHSSQGLLGYIYAGLLYIALPVSLLPMIMMDGDVFDGWMLLSFFILIWISDVGAFCVGSWLGQREGAKKLAPSISPKKSWWGFWSAVVFCVAAAAGLHALGWLSFPLVHCMAVGVIISVGGVCGDLVESMWKRYFGVKDSGNCIPGHGGMLDRFDSSLVAIPLAVVYLEMFNLI